MSSDSGLLVDLSRTKIAPPLRLTKVRVDAGVTTGHLSCRTVHAAFTAHGSKSHRGRNPISTSFDGPGFRVYLLMLVTVLV